MPLFPEIAAQPSSDFCFGGGRRFHYTSYAERMETEHFVKGGGASQKSKAHSAHFHLKIRITKKVYITRMPIFSALKYDEIEVSCSSPLHPRPSRL